MNYRQLNSLYEMYAERGLEILAFPCTQVRRSVSFFQSIVTEFFTCWTYDLDCMFFQSTVTEFFTCWTYALDCMFIVTTWALHRPSLPLTVLTFAVRGAGILQKGADYVVHPEKRR